MIQHVTIEVKSEQERACSNFYRLLGFDSVDTPAGITGRSSWVQNGEFQIHMLLTDMPAIAINTHFALVVKDYEQTFAELSSNGYQPSNRTAYWGSPRAYVRDPAGNLVEIMAYPPS